jgi:hypothetical protein
LLFPYMHISLQTRGSRALSTGSIGSVPVAVSSHRLYLWLSLHQRPFSMTALGIQTDLGATTAVCRVDTARHASLPTASSASQISRNYRRANPSGIVHGCLFDCPSHRIDNIVAGSPKHRQHTSHRWAKLQLHSQCWVPCMWMCR